MALRAGRGPLGRSVAAVRPPAPALAASGRRMARMGFRQFSRRWQTGQQLIQANGITYNV